MVEKIENLQIPDDDMVGWINNLREGGFSQEEIDFMMPRLNKTYFESKSGEVIEQELEAIKKEYENKFKQALNEDQLEYFRKGIAMRIRDDVDFKE